MQFFLGAQRTTTTFGDIHQECGVGVETASSHVAAAAAETRKCQKESTTEKWEYFSCGFCVLKERVGFVFDDSSSRAAQSTQREYINEEKKRK